MSDIHPTPFDLNLSEAIEGAIVGAAAGCVLSGAIPHDRHSLVPVLCAIFCGAANGFIAGRRQRPAKIETPTP